MRKLFQTTIISGSAQIVILITQIVRLKIVAVLIGPVGMGILGNTLTFLSLIENICFLGLHIAFLRYASESASLGKFQEVSKLFSTTVFIHIVSSVLAMIISLLFLSKINLSIYQTLVFLPLSVFVIFTVPFEILRSDFINLFNAFNKIKLISKIDVLGAIINLSVTCFLIYLLGVRGIIISSFISGVLIFIATYYYYKKYFFDGIKINKIYFSNECGLKMLKYGIINQFAIFINSFSAYSLRIFVTEKLLLQGAGIFNSAISMGSYVLILQAPLGLYLYPRISSIYKDSEETITEINKVFRFILLILSPIIIFIILFSDLIIELFFTKDFLSIKDIIIWILISKYFEILQSIVSMPLIIMEKFKIYLSINMIFNFVMLALSYILLKNNGLTGIAVALGISYGLFFVLGLIASFVAFKLKITKENLFIFSTSLLLFIIANNRSNDMIYFRVISLMLLLLCLAIFVRKNEWKALFKYFN